MWLVDPQPAAARGYPERYCLQIGTIFLRSRVYDVLPQGDE
jgi:hypothetical protein